LTRDQVITAIDILDEHQFIRKVRPTGQWYQIYCPIHSGGQEKKPSCGISLEDQYRNGQMYPAGMCHCFSCGYANSLQGLVSDILKNRNLSGSGLDWLKEHVPGLDFTSYDIQPLIPTGLMTSLIDKYAAENLRVRMQAVPKFVPEEELATYRYTVPYMYDRKLNDYVIEKYDVGYDANFIPPGRKKALPCVTFPVRNVQGQTLFLCRRSIEGKFFHYPEGSVKPVYGVYELPKDCKSVIICESVFNALTAVVYGYNAVALLGTGNQGQIDQLKKLGVREFVLCLDGDQAGIRGAEKLKKALSGHAIVWTIHMPVDKDLNDCTKEEFDLLYSRRD